MQLYYKARMELNAPDLEVWYVYIRCANLASNSFPLYLHYHPPLPYNENPFRPANLKLDIEHAI